ncbi:MAG: hypothetical protein KDA88_22390 [Planctomycetaceae bacterium]|nr:hypothetical protein [Planctomycetaceae bacterium]
MAVAAKLRCPHCKQDIKITNPALLGKKVKCPGCQKPFIASEGPPSPPEPEEEVPLRLASDDLPVGTKARIVSDAPLPPPVLNPPVPEFPQPASLEPLPPPVLNPPVVPTSIPVAPVAPAPPSFPTVADAFPAPNVNPPAPQVAAPAPQVSAPVPPAAVPPVVGSPPAGGATSELDRMRKRRGKGTWMWVLLGVVAVAVIGGAGYLVSQQKTKTPVTDAPVATTPTDNVPTNDSPIHDGVYSKRELELSTELVRDFAPAQGEPISLLMLPDGVNYVVHLRPAELWSNDFEFQVFRAALTEDVTNWMAAKIEELTKHKPEQIEELTLGIFLGARGMEPEIAAVVRLKEPGRMSELSGLFTGELAVELPPPYIKMTAAQAVWIQEDQQTIVIWPKTVAGSGALQDSANIEADVMPHMKRLIRNSSRQNLVTIVASPTDLKIASEKLFAQPVQAPMNHLLNWFGEDVEYASWTVHPDPYLYSQIGVCAKSTSNPAILKNRLESQLADLPQIMWKDVALKMHPREKRVRDFVGRYPAMLEAFQQSTVFQNDADQLTVTTVLPAMAGPNLALATLFTVAEAEETDFSTMVAQTPSATQVVLPDTVLERMKYVKLEAEFQAKPIEEAFVYICGEMKVEVFVDGDAFKDAGWTKNMKQDFNLGVVTAERALAQIINKYDERLSQMVVSIDEKNMRITVTTKKFAERDNLPIYEFPKFDE